MGYGDPPVPLRFYREDEDQEQLKKFRCSPYSPKWKAKPQKIIRQSPPLFSRGEVEILVAVDDSKVLGVAVFEISDTPSCYVHSIGVDIDRQNEGIGKSLKRAVMVVAVDRRSGLGVESEVHTHNTYMLRINSGLNAETEESPSDREYLVTLVKADAIVEDWNVRPSR